MNRKLAKKESKGKSNIYGMCRCCLAKGNHRHISKEYNFEGIREVYLEIFIECFNLYLSEDESVSQLICSKCVLKLREASQFRAMVAESEQRLLNMAGVKDQMDTEFINVAAEEVTIDEYSPKVKQELDTEFKIEEVSEEEMDNVFIPTGDTIEADDSEALVPGEAELLARFSDGRLQRLPTRHTLNQICPRFAMELNLIKHLKVSANMVEKKLKQLSTPIPTPPKTFLLSEKAAYVNNAATLIQYSNLTPFRSKIRSGYPCFYCRKVYEDLAKMREHVKDHKPSEINRVLNLYGTESLVVYAETSDLKCNICDEAISNLNALKTHLTDVHDKKLYSKMSDRVIPFNVKGQHFECPICAGYFETFGAVERHMNGHFRNFVCTECGAGFVTKYRLKVHARSMHVDSVNPCEFCGKIFSTLQKLRNHVNTVHKRVKRFKCVKCPLRFAEYFRRQRHMEVAHGVPPLKYKCNVCDRNFDRRYALSRHLKKDHLEQRDFQCEVCAYKCFSKSELTVHMIKHGGERIFECAVCKKSYARKKTLKEHMRIHNNDRRFVCAICGQAFVQKCSLKNHLKTHHLEFVVE